MQDSIYVLKIIAGISEINSEGLTPEEVEFLDNTPEAVYDITDIIMPDGQNIRKARETECTEGVKNCLIKELLKQADSLVKDSNHTYSAGKDENGKDDPNQPAQTGLAYSYGQRNYENREEPPAGECEEEVYGLDCSGFVYRVFKSAGLDLGLTIWADRIRNVDFLNKKLKEHPVYSALTAKDMGQIPVSQFQSGDIIYWQQIRCPVSTPPIPCPIILPSNTPAEHIGIVFKTGKSLMIFQSNGTPRKEKTVKDCKKDCVYDCRGNYGNGRGPRAFVAGGPYFFEQAIYGIVRFEAGCSAPFANSLGMSFVPVQPGTFTMGSPSSEGGRWDDETQHTVTLTKGFCMQTTEVTQGQWRAVMGSNPSYFTGCGDNCPVESVSWYDVQDFISRLNEKGEGTYRLPSEAEWEYAARAGSTTAFANGGISVTDWSCNNDPNLSAMGWYCGNSGNTTHSVAQKKANSWGLYDMHGNVWEWCQDWYGDYPVGAVTDPSGPGTGSYRVVRGGGWDCYAYFCRSALRGRSTPAYRSGNLGFRLALSSGQ